ncbi:plasminogen receptor (KT) isoform X1 [Ambystoma mexicanum]|uniref:plasminogen receptor (KT) isoform X1 n=1 Tax=Ambystoma mexicanum TaxID=8296 RepID=UPI0037E8AAA4
MKQGCVLATVSARASEGVTGLWKAGGGEGSVPVSCDSCKHWINVHLYVGTEPRGKGQQNKASGASSTRVNCGPLSLVLPGLFKNGFLVFKIDERKHEGATGIYEHEFSTPAREAASDAESNARKTNGNAGCLVTRIPEVLRNIFWNCHFRLNSWVKQKIYLKRRAQC